MIRLAFMVLARAPEWLLSALLMIVLLSATTQANDLGLMEQDGLLVVSSNGKVTHQWQADKALIPASTQKILTAFLALKKWNQGHRFETDFFVDKGVLWIKGSGDPMLVSEELDLIAAAIKPLLPPIVTAIAVDNSLFSSVLMPERGRSNDPYNAPVSALAANFNTINIKKSMGKVFSAEQQTPLTPLATKLAAPLSSGRHRVRLDNQVQAARYFAELLRSKLSLAESLPVLLNKSLSDHAKPIYRHQSTTTLAEVVKGMLEYSTNFTANQLFLLMAAADAKPVTLTQAQQQYQTASSDHFGWQKLSLKDGSGLSRQNRLSARQLDEVLQGFADYQALLRRYEIGGATVYAKTGTLSDVKSMAGFIVLNNEKYRFVLLLNRVVPYGERERLLKQVVLQLKLR